MNHTLFAFALLFGVSAFSQDSNTYTEMVVEFQDFNEAMNMELQIAFQNDQTLSIINSCDALNLVVFLTKPGKTMNKSEVKAYLAVRIKDLLSEEAQSYSVQEELSPNEVLLLCRERMQQIHGVEGE